MGALHRRVEPVARGISPDGKILVAHFIDKATNSTIDNVLVASRRAFPNSKSRARGRVRLTRQVPTRGAAALVAGDQLWGIRGS